MKVVLINPKSSVFTLSRAIPLGLCYLASISEKIAQETIIIDAMQQKIKSTEEIISDIFQKYPSDTKIVFGFSLHNWNLESFEIMINALRTNYKNALFIVGGTFISSNKNIKDEKLLKNIDIAILGAGEIPFEMILKRYGENINNFNDIPNILINRNNEFIQNPINEAVLINHTEILPKRVENIAYLYGNSELSILTSRGCPGRCSYCIISGLYNGKWIARKTDDIIQEAKLAQNEQTYTVGFFVDDCFLVNKFRAIEIARRWKNEIGIPFYFAARVCDVLKFTKSELEFLHECGCFRIEIGFENFSDGVLTRYKKGVTSKQNRDAIALVKSAKIDIKADIIMWDYDTTIEEIQINLLALEENRIFCTHHLLQKLIPIQGTEIRDSYAKQNILFRENGIEDYGFKNSDVKKIYEGILLYKQKFYEKILFLENLIRIKKSKTIDSTKIVWYTLKIEELHHFSYCFAMELLKNPKLNNLQKLIESTEVKIKKFEGEIK